MWQLLKNIFTVVVVVIVGAAVLRMPQAAGVRAALLAEEATPTQVVVSLSPTPVVTATIQATSTATALPSATKTPIPTQTPTATRYVVSVSAVERQVKSAKRMISYETDIDVTVKYADENKLPLWNDGQILIMQSTYHVMASFDLNLMTTTVEANNNITVQLPAPRLEAPAMIGQPTYDYYKSGIQYYFKESDRAEWTQQAQIDARTKATRRACEIGLLSKARDEAKYIVKDLILNIDPRINTRNITVYVPEGTCPK